MFNTQNTPAMFVSLTLDEFRAIVFETVQETVQITIENLKLQPPADDDYITIAEVCRILRVSKPTIHKMKREKRLPFYRIGRKVYFKRSEVMALPVAAKITGNS